MLPNLQFRTLTRLPVIQEGIWQTPLEWRGTPRADWFGTAVATEPLVALVLVTDGEDLYWAKSERGSEAGLEVRLTLFPDEFGVQVNFSVGDGFRRLGVSAKSEFDYLPESLETTDIQTGRIVLLATLDTIPKLTLGALFIARKDVRVGRKGLWRVREELLTGVPGLINRILTRKRCGIETGSPSKTPNGH